MAYLARANLLKSKKLVLCTVLCACLHLVAQADVFARYIGPTPGGPVLGIAPDGPDIRTIASDGVARKWTFDISRGELASAQTILAPKGNKGTGVYSAAAISPSGQTHLGLIQKGSGLAGDSYTLLSAKAKLGATWSQIPAPGEVVSLDTKGDKVAGLALVGKTLQFGTGTNQIEKWMPIQTGTLVRVQKLMGVRLSPDGSLAALSYLDYAGSSLQAEVLIVEAATGKVVATTAVEKGLGTNLDCFKVAWLDTATVVSLVGTVNKGVGEYRLYQGDAKSGQLKLITTQNKISRCMAADPESKRIYVGWQGKLASGFDVLDSSGKVVAGCPVGLYGAPSTFLLGPSVIVGLASGNLVALSRDCSKVLAESKSAKSYRVRWKDAATLSVAEWMTDLKEGGTVPTTEINSQGLSVLQTEAALPTAYQPETNLDFALKVGDRSLVSAGFDLNLVEPGNKIVATFTGPQGWLTSFALSPDGARLATVSVDGIVRLYVLPDGVSGKQLPTANIALLGGEQFAIWDPKKNFYFASPGVDARFGFQVQSDSSAEFAPMSRYAGSHSNESYIRELLKSGEAQIPSSAAGGSQPDLTEISKDTVVAKDQANKPELSIEPQAGLTLGDEENTFVASSTDARIGVLVQGMSNPEVRNSVSLIPTPKDPVLEDVTKPVQFRLHLYPGNNVFRVRLTKGGVAYDYEFKVDCRMSTKVKVPNLEVATVGISAYQGGFNPLPFCKTDAEAVSGTFKENQNRSGSTVASLGSEKVTRAELLAALQKRLASIPDDSNSDFLFYVSSHGATVPKDGKTVGVLVTSDYVAPAAGKDYSPEANSGVAWYEVVSEFKTAIKKGKVGRVVLLLDTCYSGLAATLGSTDLPIAIFTSSRANQQSTSSDAKMSDFTKAVVESIRTHSEKGALPLYRIGTKVRDAMRGKAAQLPYFYPGFPGTDEIDLLRAIE